LSFGMVNIPVKLYSTIDRSTAPGFKLMHVKDQGPIEYRRYCKLHDHEVPWSEIVKGLEVEPGSFFLFTKEELQKLRPEKSDQIEIVEFIPLGQVDRILLDSHYFIGPSKKKEKAFFIFVQALKASKKEAVGRFIMREKEYTCVVSPYSRGLLLSTLNYSYELRSVDEVENVNEKVSIKDQELELAVALVDKLSVSRFDNSRFKDEFMEHLKSAVAKRDRKELVVVEAKEMETPEENLMDALRQSLEA